MQNISKLLESVEDLTVEYFEKSRPCSVYQRCTASKVTHCFLVSQLLFAASYVRGDVALSSDLLASIELW